MNSVCFRSFNLYNSLPIVSNRPLLCHKLLDNIVGISNLLAPIASISSSIKRSIFFIIRNPFGKRVNNPEEDCLINPPLIKSPTLSTCSLPICSCLRVGMNCFDSRMTLL